MNKTYAILLTFLLAAGCTSSADGNTAGPSQIPAAETIAIAEVSAEAENVTDITVTEEYYHMQPQEENVRFWINDQTSLHLIGSQQSTPYCQSGSCVVYDQVLLEGTETTELEMFEDLDVKINSEYGMCTLRPMDDLWFFSYNSAAQFAGTYAMLFDENGIIYYLINNADITMNTEDSTKFILAYPCGRNDDNCVGVMEKHEADIFDVNGSEVTVMPYDNELDQLRYTAYENGGLVSVAVISGLYGTVQESYEATIYPSLYPFMSDIDADHTVMDKGDMLICVVPTDPEATLVINDRSNWNDPKILYKSESGEPVFVVTKLNDSSTEISVTDSHGETVSFLPIDYNADETFIDGIVHNFSYKAEPTDFYRQGYFDVLYEQYPEIDQYASGPDNWTETITLDGKVCYIAYYGTIQPNGWFTRERTFAVAEDRSRVYEYNTAQDVWEYYE